MGGWVGGGAALQNIVSASRVGAACVDGAAGLQSCAMRPPSPAIRPADDRSPPHHRSCADAAIREISRVAEEVNTNVDNIGARRLHTILERIVEDVSFDAPEKVGRG